MESLAPLRTFVTVLRAGSLAAASKQLHLTPSAVSKQLVRLEEELGVALVRRTTRRLQATNEGERFFGNAVRLLADYEAARAELQLSEGRLAGTVRVSAPQLFGQERVAGVVARFLEKAPDVDVELDLSDRFVDLISERFDVVIRSTSRLESSSLTSVKLGVMRFVLVASPAYLKRRGTPKSPKQLENHACLELAHGPERGRWKWASERASVDVKGPLVVNNFVALHRATLAGAGIAQLPEYLVDEGVRTKRLVLVLPQYEVNARNVYALWQEGAAAPRRVRAFVDHLVAEIPPTLALGRRPTKET